MIVSPAQAPTRYDDHDVGDVDDEGDHVLGDGVPLCLLWRCLQ